MSLRRWQEAGRLPWEALWHVSPDDTVTSKDQQKPAEHSKVNQHESILSCRWGHIYTLSKSRALSSVSSSKAAYALSHVSFSKTSSHKTASRKKPCDTLICQKFPLQTPLYMNVRLFGPFLLGSCKSFLFLLPLLKVNFFSHNIIWLRFPLPLLLPVLPY